MEMFKALIDLSTPGFLELFQLNESLYGVAASYSNRSLIHTNLNQQMYLQVTMYTVQMLQKYRVILIIVDMSYCILDNGNSKAKRYVLNIKHVVR